MIQEEVRLKVCFMSSVVAESHQHHCPLGGRSLQALFERTHSQHARAVNTQIRKIWILPFPEWRAQVIGTILSQAFLQRSDTSVHEATQIIYYRKAINVINGSVMLDRLLGLDWTRPAGVGSHCRTYCHHHTK